MAKITPSNANSVCVISVVAPTSLEVLGLNKQQTSSMGNPTEYDQYLACTQSKFATRFRTRFI